MFCTSLSHGGRTVTLVYFPSRSICIVRRAAGACNAPEPRCRFSVIEEIELYDMDLFDLVVGALCKNEKKENPAGYNMMKVLIPCF
jgi:hypothetical protein